MVHDWSQVDVDHYVKMILSRVKLAAERRGYGSEKVSDLSGVDQQTVSEIFGGRTSATIEEIVKILLGLRMRPMLESLVAPWEDEVGIFYEKLNSKNSQRVDKFNF